MTTKKPWLAGVLSVVLPGAGLVYLGKWLPGLVNFALVQALLMILIFAFGDAQVVEHIHYVFLAAAAASGGYAHAVATGMQQSTATTL